MDTLKSLFIRGFWRRLGLGPLIVFLTLLAYSSSTSFANPNTSQDSLDSEETPTTHAEARPQADKPLCLVLSGGGARGAAHVGVLKVLEELRIPIDCVVGTSMGSIVGGLYASGMSPEAMDKALRSVDWGDAFDDSPPRRQLHFRLKQDDRLSLLPFELGVSRQGFRSSAGLIAGQKIRFIFRRLSLHTLAVEHFDQLKIPFRAIAADLEDGSLVVIEDGSLAQAMRASMAVPGVFTPVQRGDRTLVDGGITANLPVEVAQALGAQRILAVDISGRRQMREGQSAVGVLFQALSVVHKRNVEASKRRLGPEDILIEPDLGDVRSTSFDRIGEAIDSGEAAARSQMEVLSRFSVSEAEYLEFLSRQRLKKGKMLPPTRVDEVQVTGSDRVDVQQISTRIETRPGEALDLEKIKADLDRVYQIGEFNSVDYRIKRQGDRTLLAIDTEDKPWGPNYLRAGLTFSANLEGQSDFRATASYRRTQLNRRGAEWKTVLLAGDVNSIYTELFQPVNFHSSWFIRPYFELVQDQIEEFARTQGEVEFVAPTVGLDVGFHLRNYAEFTLGIESGTLDISTSNGSDIDTDRGGLRATLTYDQLDDTFFPRTGGVIFLNLFHANDFLGADESYDRLELELFRAKSFGRHTLLGRLRFGSSLGSEIPVYDEFELGGFTNLSAFRPRELRGDALGFLSLSYYQRKGKLYLGGALEYGNVWQDSSDAEIDDFIPSGLLFVGRETFVGPLYLGYGFAEGGEDSFYLFLGRAF